MSYTVLAVKWRPRRFEQLVGQEHVVRALANSLAAGRLHHAYLFSGTRGVGKTTLGRILAKALNCETGVVAEPCGVCAACTAIDQGRFVDLIEVDAASRTKVDDTRELLDNVQYAPTHGRFKVYLIDEVHMLSNHSFNALLKTLEEPPPHVKFLLATTDPQKLPVTVLSRCLQFNLKKLTIAQIQGQLEKICAEEQVVYEPVALAAIARAAAGSLRDALSLLDQAIAFGAGKLEGAQVSAMLGTIDRAHVTRLLEALAALDGSAMLQEVAQLDTLAPDYGTALDDLMEALQAIAVCQLVGTVDTERFDEASVRDLAQRIAPEDVQLYYQIAVQGRRDLPVARDARIAFEMTLLRMLAFRPADAGTESGAGIEAARSSDTPSSPAQASTRRSAPPANGSPGSHKSAGAARARAAVAAATGPSAARHAAPSTAASSDPLPSRPAAQHAARGRGTHPATGSSAGSKGPQAAPITVPRDESDYSAGDDPGYDPAYDSGYDSAYDREEGAAAGSATGKRESGETVLAPAPSRNAATAHEPDGSAAKGRRNGSIAIDWAELIRASDLRGAARQLAEHCVLLGDDGGRLELMLSDARAALNTEQLRLRLQTWLGEYLGRNIQLRIRVGQPSEPTPAERRAATENERMRRARMAVQQDPNVKALQSAFDAVLEDDSIEPVESARPGS